MAKTGKPNILFIMADDIGWFNLSCYNHGIMGYRTPNMDRIAREGAMFTDFYGQQSCTAGRAAFLTGQQPIRTGLTKVGMPGATLGDGELMALRVHQYKIVFAEQRSTGLDVWREPLSKMRIPKMFDLRSDPFERGEESFKYNDWFVEHVPFQYVAQAVAFQWLESFKEFPPRQKAASFSVDQIVEKLMPKS